MVKVLITCTSPRCDDYVSDLNLKNINATAIPALIVRHLDTPKPDGDFDAMLVTSHHAKINDLPDLKTIEIAMGDSGIHDLDLSNYQNILYPCATQPTYIPDNCTPWPVYETQPHPDFKIDDDIDIVCVFSIKSAKIIEPLLKPHHIVLCLSQNIADNFKNSHIQKLAVCTCPRYDDMILLILKEVEAHT